MNFISTNKAPQAIGPYSQAVQIGEFVFFSGQIGLEPKTMKLVDGGIESQTKQVFANVKAILDSLDLSFNNIVKAQVFLQDMNHFNLVNKIYTEYLNGHKPARDTVEVSKLPLSSLIEISVIATSQK